MRSDRLRGILFSRLAASLFNDPDTDTEPASDLLPERAAFTRQKQHCSTDRERGMEGGEGVEEEEERKMGKE